MYTGWDWPSECLKASPVALLTSAEAGMPSSSLTLVLKRMSLYQCWWTSLGLAGGEHDGAVADGEAVVLVAAAEDLEHLVGAARPRRRGSRLVVVVVPEPRHLWISTARESRGDCEERRCPAAAFYRSGERHGWLAPTPQYHTLTPTAARMTRK